MFNPNNGSIEAPNGDGIDLDSSSNVHMHDCLMDVADDSLCCKSGADWLGRNVGMPTKNVLFENIEVRNGHGLTLGSEASGGMLNITYRGIFLNGAGGPQNCPQLKRRCGAVGGIHFKTGRGRGGLWRDISWINITGNNAIAFVGFSENHGTSLGPEPTTGPTNATGTPVIENLLIKDVFLTDVAGPSEIFTLAESPIQNFTLSNVTWSARRGAKTGYVCQGWNGTKTVNELFASGRAVNVMPALPTRECGFLPVY